MNEDLCDRCGKSESIPTHQFVKYEEKIRYLDRECFDSFRKWLIAAKRTKEGLPGKGQCGRCGKEEYIPTHQLIKDGFDSGNHYLCKGCWDGFRKWYSTGKSYEKKADGA